MEITLKDTQVAHEIGGEKFTVDFGDPTILDAHDEMLDYLGSVKKEGGASSVEMNDRLNDYLHTVFGEEQYAKLSSLGATNSVNAQRIVVALVADVNKLNSENDVTKIMEEFGL